VLLDEFGYQRWLEVAPTWGLDAAEAPRADNNQQWRTIGARTALTGQGKYWDGYLVGRRQGIPFSSHLDRAYSEGNLMYVIQDNGYMHTHPDVLTVWARYPRVAPVWLPTSAP
jgi:hypothetical protein